MQYRNELKYVITPADRAAICANMRVVAQLDSHVGAQGDYLIRSLYFDNLADKALREKIDGVNEREKFRIRYYNGDTSFIHLEKKVKRDGLGYKLTETITAEEAQRIVDGDTAWMATSGRALLVELYAKMKSQGLHPSTIVDYERIPFVYAPGNVRVTLDYNIRTEKFFCVLVYLTLNIAREVKVDIGGFIAVESEECFKGNFVTVAHHLCTALGTGFRG